MMSAFSLISLLLNPRRGALLISAIAITTALAAGPPAIAQTSAQTSAPKSAQDPPPPPSPGDNIRYGYAIHQSIDLGGHIANYSGNDAMYDTLVNFQSGPRILDQSLEMIAVDPAKAPLFDHLSTTSFGYGGDPYNVTFLNFSKGRIYDFHSSFRRNRQYFDDNLLANPLIPPTSTPFVPILDTPHLYNTVRRMTDTSLTVAPLSVVSAHFGYFQNVNQGPTTSTLHVGAEALLTQYWRNLHGCLERRCYLETAARHQRRLRRVHHPLQGQHSLGAHRARLPALQRHPCQPRNRPLFGLEAVPCASPFNPDGTVNPTCSGFLSYTRYAPTRTLFPSEQFRFQSTSIPHFTMNGRVLYMGTTSHLTNFNESLQRPRLPGAESRRGCHRLGQRAPH